MPPGGVRIQVRLRELRQLFNEMDPSPFHERDLAPDAEEFIVEWAREAPRDAPLDLIVHLDHPSGDPNEVTVLQDAVGRYFQRRATATRRRLRDLFSRGRVSLGIGLAFLALAGVLANAVNDLVRGDLGGLLRESLIIGGWVAMWRPLEVFLYDWWPIRAQARLFERLATMPVRLEHAGRLPGGHLAAGGSLNRTETAPRSSPTA
jgi:hypothetical protein